MHYQFDWAIVASGKYFEWLLSGLATTIKLSAVSIVLSFLLGLAIVVMRMSRFRPSRWFAHCRLEFFRMFIAVIYFVLCFAFTELSRWLEHRSACTKSI